MRFECPGGNVDLAGRERELLRPSQLGRPTHPLQYGRDPRCRLSGRDLHRHGGRNLCERGLPDLRAVRLLVPDG